MYASGQDVEDGILLCQGKDGQFFRSPLRRERADNGEVEINSFSRDMATGLSLAAAADAKREFGGKIFKAYERWLKHVIENGCRACKDSDGRCLMTPGVFWMAHEAGVRSIPSIYKLTSWLQAPYLYIAASLNKPGYTMHLVGVSLFASVISRGGRSNLSFFAKLAAKKLSSRQPENPFFAWLDGRDHLARAYMRMINSQITLSGQGRRHQWGWERADAEEAWRDSCGWDLIFMENLLNNNSL